MLPFSTRAFSPLSLTRAHLPSWSRRNGTPARPALLPPSRKAFHDYFVTHLPSSSLHPDSGAATGPEHKPTPDTLGTRPHRSDCSPAASPPNTSHHRDLVVVRIPLQRARHHFGVASARGNRAYNEDTHQAGTIDLPAFAKLPPISLVNKPITDICEATPAEGAFGDPQTFYFGIFDGHGGSECSHFLRDHLHYYIEKAANRLGLASSLHIGTPGAAQCVNSSPGSGNNSCHSRTDSIHPIPSSSLGSESEQSQSPISGSRSQTKTKSWPNPGTNMNVLGGRRRQAPQLHEELLAEYKYIVGGYFRRLHPRYFPLDSDQRRLGLPSLEAVLEHAFLRADLDFITAQAQKAGSDDAVWGDRPLNDDDALVVPHQPSFAHRIGGRICFKGGSTASVALISTPTPSPFWHPETSSTLLVAHVGDTRVLICDTRTGTALPLTTNHHPSSPVESRRLRRYLPSIVTGDSFGEERIMGLANSRAFGDLKSKRVGVSAEPDMTRVELGPAQYSFLVLMSDGVSGSAGDQEIVDIVKEAGTPDEGAVRVVDYATSVSGDGDNATCLVVRLGGWERRCEGGVGSLGTKEVRDVRLAEAQNPRRGQM